MYAWAMFQLPNGMIQEQLRCGCAELPLDPQVHGLHSNCTVYDTIIVLIGVSLRAPEFLFVLALHVLFSYKLRYNRFPSQVGTSNWHW